VHHMRFRIRALGPIAEPIIGNVFIHPVASRTLRCMKQFLESSAEQPKS
jgi:hypothetical protein